jgi:Protein of unknown function (DUF1592)/Protein of unknown function (DUF1588)/Protein of unknown function (DUF1595)
MLSELQHLGALSALLGPEALRSEDTGQYSAKTKPFSQKGRVVNATVVSQRLVWAEHASGSAQGRIAQLTGCEPSAADDGCARGFFARFLPKAFRRPAEPGELDDLMEVYAVGKATSFTRGIALALEALLAAPSFMYRRELGAPNTRGGLTLTPHELASALSFMLTDAPPDDALRAAADSGALGSPDELKRQVARLLSDVSVQSAVSSTLISAWNLANLFGSTKDPALFPEYTPALQAAMYHESELFVADVLWTRARPVSELLTARTTFVNEALATLYGVPFTGASGSYAPITLPAGRAGLLTQPGFMAALSRTDTTSVVARGLFTRGPLLCQPKMPAPPESLAGRIEELLAADMTERERADVRAGDSACAGCHAGIDPFGLVLESFDPIGRARSTVKGKPIDTRVTLNAGELSGDFADVVALAEAAAASGVLEACTTRHLLAYATQNDELSAGDCAVRSLVESAAQPTLPSLITAITTSPALVERVKESL